MQERSIRPLDTLTALATKWTALSAFGAFALYTLGYLAVRFEYNVYGVVTSLDIFDDSYLFGGCRFLVFLVMSLGNLALVALVVAGLGYVVGKLMPTGVKDRLRRAGGAWLTSSRVAVAGVIFGILFIQIVLRQCLVFAHLLLLDTLPNTWLTGIVLSGPNAVSFYFSALVAGVLFTGAVLVYALRAPGVSSAAGVLAVRGLALVALVEFLFLPVNYGMLVAPQYIARVAPAATGTGEQAQETKWLIRDGKNDVTYLVRTPENHRMLLTTSHEKGEVKIVGFDDVVCELFGPQADASPRCSPAAESEEDP